MSHRTKPARAPWPARVDQLLERDLSDTDVDRWVQSAAVLHSNGDGLDIAVKDGRIVGVRGRAVDRVNHGRVDPKDLYGWQANNSDDRLTRPLIREGGELVETDWDTAMGRIVERSQELRADAGGWGRFGFYTSGQLFLEEYYTLAVIGKAGLGTPHMDGNTRLCTATAAAALKASFGTDGQPGSYRDIDHCDAIALWGHNVAETQTVLWMRMLDRRRGADPPRMLAVDPRRTPVAREADIHLAIRNGTNQALMNALLREIIEHDWYDAAYVDAHTIGFDRLERVVAGYDVRRAAEICGIPARQIEEAAELLGTSQRLLSTVLQGFYQSNQATASSCQVNNLHLLRGMIGRPGAGIYQMNGQPTAQNTRETGADGDLSGLRNWENKEHVRELARALERRRDRHPALVAADACDADLALRRAGLDQAALDLRDEPRGLAPRARARTADPREGRPHGRRPGHVPDGDRPLRGRRVARRWLGREAGHVHERRPHRAPLGGGRRATWRSAQRPRHLPRVRAGAWTSATATARR